MKVGPKVENISIPSSSNNPASFNKSSDIFPLFSSSSNCFDITQEVIALSDLCTMSKVAFKVVDGASNTFSITSIVSSICTTNSLIFTNKSEYLVVINKGRPKPGGTDCGIGREVIILMILFKPLTGPLSLLGSLLNLAIRLSIPPNALLIPAA